jgi:hypothetical protein
VLPKNFALAATLICALSAPAVAQSIDAPLTYEAGQLALTSAGQRLALPMPDWALDAADLAALDERVSTTFEEENGQAHLEIYPLGEGEAFWSTLYGARLLASVDMPLVEFRDLVIGAYAQACSPDTVALFQLEPDQGDVLPPMGYVCGAYDDGSLAGQGEVMVVGFYRSDAGIGMVYQEWRGEAFNPEDESTWPVRGTEVEAKIAQLKAEVTLSVAD